MKNRLRQPLIGDVAPDFTLPTTAGGVVTLSEYPKPAMLIFLRHLA